MIKIPYCTVDAGHGDFGPRKLEVYHHSEYGLCWELHEMMDQGFLEVSEDETIGSSIEDLVQRLNLQAEPIFEEISFDHE